MTCCDLITALGNLQKSTSKLKHKWADTKEHWNDTTQRQFEEDFLAPLAPNVTLAIAAIHRLSDILEEAFHECEEGDDSFL